MIQLLWCDKVKVSIYLLHFLIGSLLAGTGQPFVNFVLVVTIKDICMKYYTQGSDIVFQRCTL